MNHLESRLVALLFIASCVAGFLVATSGDLRPELASALLIVTISITAAWRWLGSPFLELLSLFAWLATLIAVIPILAGIPYLLGAAVVGVAVMSPLGIVLYLRKEEREAREVDGRCLYCGYDLRASSERCPECGREVEGDVYRRRRIAEELRAKRAVQTPDLTPPAPKQPAEIDNDPPLDVG